MVDGYKYPLEIRRPTHSGYNCDSCKHYRWYYDRCEKWGTEIDAREVHNCFEPRTNGMREAAE